MVSNSYPAPVRDELAPRMLKRYRLLGQLARGGMAEVFLASVEGIGGFERLMVIKRLLPALASNPELVQMLLDEARIAATLHHANIVQVTEVDMVDGQVFYAMEHLHGQDVATMQARLAARAQQVSLDHAIAIAIAVAAGLHYAHERVGSDGQPLEIVHRDVAPSNVIVTYDGNVKLIDFGIAKAANNLSTTRFGLFKGKLPYASPEQCRCEPVDRRTDVFSLGVLLYELTTGERLFTGADPHELLRVVLEAVVPRPRLRDPSYPRELEMIVLKALARDRHERYVSAQALQADLEMLANKLALDRSARSLSRWMEQLFTDELQQWRSAQQAGFTLEHHLLTTTTSTWSRAPLGAGSSNAGDSLELTDADPIIMSESMSMQLQTATFTTQASMAASVSMHTSLRSSTSTATVHERPARPTPDAGPRTQIRRRRTLATTAATLAAGLGLVAAGALGARWWGAPPAPGAAVSPAAPATARQPMTVTAAVPAVLAAPEARPAAVTDPAPERKLSAVAATAPAAAVNSAPEVTIAHEPRPALRPTRKSRLPGSRSPAPGAPVLRQASAPRRSPPSGDSPAGCSPSGDGPAACSPAAEVPTPVAPQAAPAAAAPVPRDRRALDDDALDKILPR